MNTYGAANPADQKFYADQDHTTKVARLKQILEMQSNFPGRAPGGTGLTGLTSNDANGWSNVLNEQTEGVNLGNELAGKGPANVRMGRPQPSSSLMGNLADDPAWWLMDDNNGSGDDPDPLSRIPASVLGLYAASHR